jgi:hypothetical protein
MLTINIVGALPCALIGAVAWSVAAADDLPRELLLQCEGKSIMFLMDGDKPTEMKSDAFKGMQLRLRDGVMVDTEVNVVYGRSCNLEGGKIWCELNEAIYIPEFNSTEKRHLWISLVRETGELRLSIETRTFNGKSTTGKPRGGSQIRKSGVCRTIGKPLF